ncbi:ESX secretion-associated protein EspG [Gordonia sp. (in: high G+C Gram-positive bacteria)]|uniref:ESX secretion-associated protein EspG n=1 Tax=Gordonia sp. (in: high G+C Gram-positive bacteria) TaxID=84139 RepID=UPI0039E38A69
MDSVVFCAHIVAPGEQMRRIESDDPAALVDALPLTGPVRCGSVRVRAGDLLPRLDGAHDAADVVTALHNAGAGGTDAATLAGVLGGASACAEIVAQDEAGRVLPGAVAVFCSTRGDAVTIPSTAADGATWFTVAPATARRIVQGCADLAQRRRAVR